MTSLEVLVTPSAAREQVGPYADGVLTVRVTRPPAAGEANQAVLRLLAQALRMPISSLQLVAGARSRRKRFAVEGIGEAELAARLSRLAD
jgi:hypothetical protein